MEAPVIGQGRNRQCRPSIIKSLIFEQNSMAVRDLTVASVTARGVIAPLGRPVRTAVGAIAQYRQAKLRQRADLAICSRRTRCSG